MAKQGLYANIHASKGAPTAQAFIQSAKTAKKPKKVK